MTWTSRRRCWPKRRLRRSDCSSTWALAAIRASRRSAPECILVIYGSPSAGACSAFLRYAARARSVRHTAIAVTNRSRPVRRAIGRARQLRRSALGSIGGTVHSVRSERGFLVLITWKDAVLVRVRLGRASAAFRQGEGRQCLGAARILAERRAHVRCHGLRVPRGDRAFETIAHEMAVLHYRSPE